MAEEQFQLPESATAVIPQELGQDFLSTLSRLMQVGEKKQMEDLLGFQESRGLLKSGDTNRRLVEEVLGPGMDRRNAQLLGLALEGAKTGQGQRFQKEMMGSQQGFQKDILGLEQGFGREMFGKESEFRKESERFQASESRERMRQDFLNQLEQMKEQTRLQEQLMRLQESIETTMFYRRKDAGQDIITQQSGGGFFGQIARQLPGALMSGAAAYATGGTSAGLSMLGQWASKKFGRSGYGNNSGMGGFDYDMGGQGVLS